MIKTFESFNKGNNFLDILNGIRLLYNDSYPGIGNQLDGIDDVLYYTIMDDDNLFREPNDINIDSIEKSDKDMLINLYNELYNQYKLDEFPDFNKTNEILLHITDITEVDFCILLESKSLTYDIDTIPGVKTFPNRDKIEFNIDEWDSIINEIKPSVKRIEDLGYNVVTTMGSHGKIKLTIS